MAHLSSLMEVTVASALEPGTSITVAADIEPSLTLVLPDGTCSSTLTTVP